MEQEEILVELAQQDAACAACLGGFVVTALAQLRLLLPGAHEPAVASCSSCGAQGSEALAYICRPDAGTTAAAGATSTAGERTPPACPPSFSPPPVSHRLGSRPAC